MVVAETETDLKTWKDLEESPKNPEEQTVISVHRTAKMRRLCIYFCVYAKQWVNRITQTSQMLSILHLLFKYLTYMYGNIYVWQCPETGF